MYNLFHTTIHVDSIDQPKDLNSLTITRYIQDQFILEPVELFWYRMDRSEGYIVERRCTKTQ